MRLFLIMVGLTLVTACATPETRLKRGLQNAGLSEAMAGCMAERMVDRLSLLQLRRLGDLPYARDERNIDGFLHRVRALRDPEILRVTSSSAALCAAGVGP